MFDSILVVCAGNICRSPTAEYVLKAKLADKQIKVSSAGLTALVGKPADPMAQKIAASHGVVMDEHKGQQLSSQLVGSNSVILVMEQRHLNDLHSRYPEARGKTFLLGKWINNAEIPDPYRQSQEAFEHVYALIDSACSAWQKYL
ncbi:low molecular weight protein-tyrosine-phosphatase [Shewanella xiamenensis]|jgi:protein-tyrosine phosphatase|uniref:low molecular weight protein-tyrosine-phosphatase n=1 Tax=Gammaproteobacteria TaxID=1236 RepID=UPI000E06DE1B|nr:MULTISPECIES: low molecular weight protein-tyrosine-phosphatase [Gammaproteobacteria]MBP6083761.1 low molecular weight phosphotyrosine protein phosphatase [Providencia sp.]QQK59339.1 low molecular weight phosphotyrosine protein phosphatase [Shewanella sp. LC6]TPE56486.1 low molecular weight phosphotyrosine protein phosphatase [Shewanella sp. LC2]SUJ08236.1 Low molecular weight protein-tyrosine-phosphatase wzb [Shewanella putrefaciens]